MKQIRAQIPNILTVLRICGTAVLLIIRRVDTAFYVIYTLCFISDIADGHLARAMGVESALGARLDSIADLFMYGVMAWCIFPELWVISTLEMKLLALSVLLVRIAAYLVAAIKFHRFSAIHTYLNKAMGFCLFIVVYLFRTPYYPAWCIVAGAIGMLASVEELIMHCRNKTYRTDCKSLFLKCFCQYGK